LILSNSCRAKSGLLIHSRAGAGGVVVVPDELPDGNCDGVDKDVPELRGFSEDAPLGFVLLAPKREEAPELPAAEVPPGAESEAAD
jgi:hypothetical protein